MTQISLDNYYCLKYFLDNQGKEVAISEIDEISTSFLNVRRGINKPTVDNGNSEQTAWSISVTKWSDEGNRLLERSDGTWTLTYQDPGANWGSHDLSALVEQNLVRSIPVGVAFKRPEGPYRLGVGKVVSHNSGFSTIEGPVTTIPEPVIDFGPLGSDITTAIERLIKVGRRNFMIAGSPGTGKTVLAKKIKFNGGNAGVEVQFHPAFFYEDFIEGLRPNVNVGPDDTRQFIPAPGLFVKAIGTFEIDSEGEPRACKTSSAIADYLAYARETNHWDWNYERDAEALPPFFFIIDEINRANLPRVFGEALSQIDDDKRPSSKASLIDHPVTLPNSGQFFVVPPHVIIVSTMNTADRSIKSIDAAILRRFAKLTVGLDGQALLGQCRGRTALPWTPARVVKAFRQLNELVREELTGQHNPFGERWFELGVGPSYFWPTDNRHFDDQFFEDAVTYDVLPYLESVMQPSDAQRITRELLSQFRSAVSRNGSSA